MYDIVTPNTGPLKRKRNRLLLGGIVVAVAGLAIAASAGKYYCAECKFDQPLAFGDTEMYIRSEVNQHINSWVDSKGRPMDVTICNGSQCATFLYVKLSAVWILKKLENSTWKGDGGSGGVSGDFGGMGGGGGWWDGGTGGGDPFSGTGTVVVSDPENVQ